MTAVYRLSPNGERYRSKWYPNDKAVDGDRGSCTSVRTGTLHLQYQILIHCMSEKLKRYLFACLFVSKERVITSQYQTKYMIIMVPCRYLNKIWGAI